MKEAFSGSAKVEPNTRARKDMAIVIPRTPLFKDYLPYKLI